MPYVLKHRSFPSHHEHAHTPQTHINAHAHTQTTMHTEEHILNHSQAQSHVHSHKEYTHIDIHIIICTEKTQVEHTHTHTQTRAHRTHRHRHTVLCVFNLLASAASAHGLPQTLVPCAVHAPARAPCGQCRPTESKCATLWLGSTILGPALGTLLPWISYSLGVRQLRGRGPPAQLLQPSSLGAGWGGEEQPGILMFGLRLPPGSLRTSRKDPTVGEVAWSIVGHKTRRGWALSPGFLLQGPLSSMSGTKGGKMGVG